MATSSAGLIADAPMMTKSAELRALLKKSIILSPAMKAQLGKWFVPPTSLTDLSLTVLCGLSYATGAYSMKHPLGYMQTAAGLVEQFQRIDVMIEHNSGNPVSVEAVLKSFFLRMSDGDTLAALSQVVDLPTGGESTMILYLEYLEQLLIRDAPLTVQRRQHIETIRETIKRHLKAMEIASTFLDQAGRMFIWTERGVRMAARDNIPNKELYKDQVKQWSGKAHRKDKNEPKSAIDDGILSIFEAVYKATEMTVFHFSIKLSEDGLVIARGTAGTLEEAADMLYRAFYRALTKKRYVDASAVQIGTKIVMLGNWITNEQYMSYKNKRNLIIVSDASEDTRDDLIFVLGWPELGKQKALVTAHKVRKARSYGEMNADNVMIELRSGYTIDATDNFYVYRSEQNVLGEIMCAKCQRIGSVSSMACVSVRGRGLICGPCIDELMNTEQLDDDAFDMADVIMPPDTQTLVSMSEEENS